MLKVSRAWAKTLKHLFITANYKEIRNRGMRFLYRGKKIHKRKDENGSRKDII